MGLFGNNEKQIKMEYANQVSQTLGVIMNEMEIVRTKIEENNKNHWDLGKELNQFCVKVLDKINDEPDVYKLDKFEMTELINLNTKYVEHHKKINTNYDLVFDLQQKQVKRVQTALSEFEKAKRL